jgi:hypothetical protein
MNFFRCYRLELGSIHGQGGFFTWTLLFCDAFHYEEKNVKDSISQPTFPND